MNRAAAVASLLLVGACSRAGFDAPHLDGTFDRPIQRDSRSSDGRDSSSPSDTGADAISFGKGSWLLGPAARLDSLNSPASDNPACPVAGGLKLYFNSRRAGGVGEKDSYFATRPSRTATFGNITAIAGINSTASDELVTLDDLTAFYVGGRPGGGGGGIDIWIGRRVDTGTPWDISQFSPLTELNGAGDDWDAMPSRDLLRLYFAPQVGQNVQIIVVATRPSTTAAFQPPVPLDALNSNGLDSDPTLSPGERVIVFVSKRPGGNGQSDLWYAVREHVNAPFGAPAPLPGVNTAYNEREPCIASDGTELYFSSDRPGGQGYSDIYSAAIFQGP